MVTLVTLWIASCHGSTEVLTHRLARNGRRTLTPRTIGVRGQHGNQASLWHFFIKLVFAAPASAFPSLPIALGSHASRVHFVMKLFSAAPANGLPFLPMAWVWQALSAVAAEPSANVSSKATRPIRRIFRLHSRVPLIQYVGRFASERNCRHRRPDGRIRARQRMGAGSRTCHVLKTCQPPSS
jgi:hypothetical protein